VLPAGANLYVIVYTVGILFILLAPAITGVFWGAPLIAREFETGTGRLTWNQSITRARWLTVKLALTGAAAVAVTEGFSLLQAWWAAPISRAVDLGGSVSVFSGSRFSPLNFATGGIAPLGYAAFGFALGVTAGLLIRRTVPAMAATHATFSDVSGASVLTANAVPGRPGAWILSSGPVNAAGRPVSALPAACAQTAASPRAGAGGGTASPGGVQGCLAGHGIREAVSFQPAGRYWPLQLAETAIFLVLALGLAGFCFWWLDRRLS
jgi:hypothetical protein